MPIYEYKCFSCSVVFEELRKIVERDDLAYCKKCGSTAHPILSSFNAPGMPTKRQGASPSQSPASGGIQLKDNTIVDCNVGVSIPKGTKIDMKGNRFINVKKPVEFRDE